MRTKRKRKMIALLFCMLGLSIATTLILIALKKNIDLYYTPTQLLTAHIHPNQVIRLGGLVQRDSIVRNSKNLKLSFILKDQKYHLKIRYNGVLPALFSEGRGVIVQGKFIAPGVFQANQVLAKHDEKYIPPGVS